MNLFKSLTFVLFCLFFITIGHTQNENLFTISNEKDIPNTLGLNGAFIGVHNNALIIAGGTNFPKVPVWEGGKKKWHDAIYILEKQGDSSTWHHPTEIKLPKPLANGVSINTSKGVLCIGGDNENGIFNDVFLLKWDSAKKTITIENLPSTPIPLSNMGGDRVGDLVYLIGGQQKKGGKSTSSFLSFNLTASLSRKIHTWEQLPDFPGKDRIQPIVVGQSNGHQDCLYVFSGLSYNPNTSTSYEMLSDVYEFDPHKIKWTKKNPIPSNNTPGISGGYLAAAPALKKGDSHILIFGGAGGEKQHLSKRVGIAKKLETLKNQPVINDSIKAEIHKLELQSKTLLKTTSFSKTIWAYHTITDTWTSEGTLKEASQVVTKAVEWGGHIAIPGGEISPGVRTNKIKILNLKPYEANFGLINYITLIVYLLLMVFMGWYFSRRNKSTNDYFLGGGRIPWWAAGLSIYATMLSAITYLSQPALAYAFDWQAYLGYFSILLIAPLVIVFYLPFFRKLKLTTAYEYLEKRFNITIRLFSSISFTLFQLVRMGIVVYLPALALSTVMGLDIYLAIVIMGILAVMYTYMGGIEAVIWTDVIQVIVLILGLIAGLVFIGIEIGDVGYIFDTAMADSKLQMFDLRFSFTEVVTWSLFLGSFALNFASYTTDQAVIQRYMTTSNEKEARKSIWLNGIIAIPFGILIFTMGTFLYVYFKEHPEFLTVGMQNDSVFPLFITNHLPPGIAGLVIAGIFSASMSSLDSSMHSVSTVVTVDYYQRFYKTYTDKKGLKLAKWITLGVGILGTIIACLMAAFPVTSIFFFFQEIIGLFGSAIAGIFLLGIFVKKANWKGTLVGAISSIVVLVFIKYTTDINFYIYPLIAIPTCVGVGYVFSFIIPVKSKDVEGLVYFKKQH
ncbi:sodium:solute symporter family transporter [Snuella sedimenti]|uniref:Sodium/solute symporter n=1 Tax=Snuella sedimenti TaxID=2798802 RepID=A0A8J7LRZ1_9FLAO|nr:sodium/solute symporter [Snuella sedimenti]MBJ6367815.1 sodium/solute symporter [Snuella sedimenti]